MNPFVRVMFKIIDLFTPDGGYGDNVRGMLYKPFLLKCGKNFKVARNAFIFNPSGLSVGDNVYIGVSSYLGQGDIIIEDDVLIGNGVSITASNHMKKNGSYRFGGYQKKRIIIKSGSWIAANSAIMAGVTIGEGALVAAGAIVTKNVNAHSIVVGIPAQEKK